MTTPATGASEGNPGKIYDAADWQDLPRQSYSLLYQDGDYAAPPDAPQQLDLRGWHGITVWGNPAWPVNDWEPGNPGFTAVLLRRFVRGRKAAGKRAIIYVQRDLAREALDVLGYGTPGGLYWYPHWWIPTLDDIHWSAADLAADLADNWDAPIPADTIWANQNSQLPALGPAAVLDVSNLFLDWDAR